MGDTGLESFSSDPLCNSLKRNPADQLAAQLGAKISLIQVVAVLIERWDSLAESVKAEIAKLLRRG